MIKNHRFIKQATKSIDCIYGLKYKNPRFLLPNKLILHSHILKQLSGHLKLHQIGTMVTMFLYFENWESTTWMKGSKEGGG